MQASHQRQLEKEGKKYAFGSYKYTAQKLYDQGILLSIDQYSPKQFDKVSITISSDEVGVFEVKAQYMGVTVTTVELKLEDLLEMQFVRRFHLVLWPRRRLSGADAALSSSSSTGRQADALDRRRRKDEPPPHHLAHQPQVRRCLCPPLGFARAHTSSLTGSTSSATTSRSSPTSLFLPPPVASFLCILQQRYPLPASRNHS